MNIKIVSLAACAASLFLAGCTPQLESVVISQLTEPPLGGHASDGRIELFEGTAVGIKLQAFTERPKDPEYKCCGADCTKQCPQFDNAIDPDEVSVGGDGNVTVLPTEDAGIYMVVAEGVGNGFVIVTAEDTNGAYEIPVTVSAQPAGEGQ